MEIKVSERLRERENSAEEEEGKREEQCRGQVRHAITSEQDVQYKTTKLASVSLAEYRAVGSEPHRQIHEAVERRLLHKATFSESYGKL